MSAPGYASIAELAASIRAGRLSPVDLTEQCLARIAALDPGLGAFRLVCPERARVAARAAELELGAGQDRGILHGIPYAAKDLYDVAGLPTSAGSRLLEGEIAARDCHAVARLQRAGMVLVGKTNTVQFAYGGAGINHDHGTPKNPWHETPHLPGGSSSGSGVAVGAGIVPMALGTDTGGSVRIPASFCGVSGLKTTVGRIGRSGVYPLSASLDSVGPLARTVADCAHVFAALEGRDPLDPSTLTAPAVARRGDDVLAGLDAGVEGLRIGFAEGVLFEDVETEVERAVRASADVFADLGAAPFAHDFHEAGEARDLNPRGLVIAAEAYSVNRQLVDTRADELDPIVGARIALGRDIRAADYLDSVRAWEALRARTHERLRHVDALLCPTVMIAPPSVAHTDSDPDTYSRINLQTLRNTAIGNILDLCGVSVPCGFTTAGLPIGLMVYGKPYDEATVLRVAEAYQQATDWHLKQPIP